MKRQAIGWTVLTLAILGAAWVVTYAAPAGDTANVPPGGSSISPSAGPCPCADGKPCTCDKDCSCQCGRAQGKPCACGATKGCKMAAGGCPISRGQAMRAKMMPDMAPLKVSPESERLWKDLGDLMAKRHQTLWELFALQGGDRPDDMALSAKRAQIAGIDRQMSVLRGRLYQHRLQPIGPDIACGIGGAMARGHMRNSTNGCGACCPRAN